MKSIRLSSPLTFVFASLGFATMALVACSSDDDDNGTPTPDAGVYIDGGIMTGAPPGPTGYGEGDSGTFTGPPADSGPFDGGTVDATSPIIVSDGGDDDDDDASDAAGDDASDAADAGDDASDAGDAGDAGDASDADAAH